MESRLELWSALRLAGAIRNKVLSPVDVARYFLDRVGRYDQRVKAFVWLRDELLLKEAKDAEKRIMAGEENLPLFFGVPLPIKDLTEVKGEPSTHGSMATRHKIGRYDTPVVESFRKAGFFLMGRTNSPEFGTLPVTENQLFGPTYNPWDLTKTPGGSSGGAAASVAAGMAPIAHASDGGGSIRIPASCCGLVGLKATRGRIPKGPYASEIMHGFSTDGAVTRTVADQAAILDVLSEFDPTAWFSVAKREGTWLDDLGPSPRLRIRVAYAGPVAVEPHQDCKKAVDEAASLLASLGHQVSWEPLVWPAKSEQLAQDFISIWCTAAAYMDLESWDQTEPLTRALRDMAFRQSSGAYIQAVLRMQVFSRLLVRSWAESFDLLLLPTNALPPPEIGWVYQTGETDPEKLLWRCTEFTPNTGWANATGQPAISLPTYWNDSGLPIGVQLVALPYREDLLLKVGHELEQAIGWDKKFPKLD